MIILAFIILGLAYIFILGPSVFGSLEAKYLDAVKMSLLSGAAISISFIGCGVITWAVIHVLRTIGILGL